MLLNTMSLLRASVIFSITVMPYVINLFQHFWNATPDDNKQSVCFNLECPDGDQGYPGELNATVCYTLNAENELKITYKAVVKDKPTIVNLTCHPYFNLSGVEKVRPCQRQLFFSI